MKKILSKQKLGIIGCGAIGSRIALSVQKELKDAFVIAGLYDIDPLKAMDLAKKIKQPKVVKHSLEHLIEATDMVVECVNTDTVVNIVKRVLMKKKNILVMSIGRLLGEDSLFLLAKKYGANIFLPSGAIGGLDAIKAASLAGLDFCQLTTTKPPQGFKGNQYLLEKKISLENLKTKKVLFSGSVRDAVKKFPQNINVSAGLTFSIGNDKLLRVVIVVDPNVETNIHHIEAKGAFGSLSMRFENNPCPDNAKTSYLAVLSAIQTLKQSVSKIKKGT